jgi:hypothetical protein
VRELRDYLTRSIKNDTPPLHSEVKRILGAENVSYREAVQLFVPGGDGGVSKRGTAYWREDELDGMSELLRAHQGDIITAHQLKELGTHPRDLEKLFRAASVAGAAVSS